MSTLKHFQTLSQAIKSDLFAMKDAKDKRPYLNSILENIEGFAESEKNNRVVAVQLITSTMIGVAKKLGTRNRWKEAQTHVRMRTLLKAYEEIFEDAENGKANEDLSEA